ncbi:CDP-alcohol phosphatidyltransferase family protein [Candidatus Pacearchaeota archaeon]|nr:CDP-alcohol phosphatidyltransferase family protein [Candidatus Pacearchaeota archaeon]
MKKNDVLASTLPNLLTISRIVLTFVIMYFLFTSDSLVIPVILFAVAALTDFFDGQLARKYNWASEFGRKADMIADRFLWIGTALAFIIAYGLQSRLGIGEGIQLLLLLSRELVTAPFALVALVMKKPIPQVRFIGKATTFMQGFALPALLLSLDYPLFTYLSLPLCIIIGITGLISGINYIKDLQKNNG